MTSDDDPFMEGIDVNLVNYFIKKIEANLKDSGSN